jgi:hypothetical protein
MIPTGSASMPNPIDIGDFNGDSRLDVDHDGKLAESQQHDDRYPARQRRRHAADGVALADLRGDGIVDIVVANSQSNNVSVIPGRTSRIRYP